MSKWTNATLTADGQNLQAQLLDGGGFEFTKVTAADSSGTDKLTLTMQPSVIAGKTITVPVLLSNSNLSAGFTMNQLKFYARKTGIPAGDEIVYAIAEDETGDEIPSESDSPGFTIDWSYTFQFGNATSVNVSIDPAGLVSMALLGSPGGIATLNNAGAVPIEQGGTGAVTASAALAALGGMRASATGDDIPTSASDPTSISSQLSNKVNSVPIVIQPSVDVLTLETGHVYAVEGEISTDYNHPINSSFAHLTYEVLGSVSGSNGYKVIKCTDAYSGKKWTRTQRGGAWNDWVPDATATPPDEYDIPFRSGWQANDRKATYCKSQEGICIVNCAVYGTGTASDNSIATLPEGFHPSGTICCAAHAYKDGVRGIAEAQINAYGDIVIYSPIEFDYVSFSCAFVAGN